MLTGERDGYYMDFGGVGQLLKAFREGYVYTGEYSRFRRRRHGSPTNGVPGSAFVVCAQNHDQVGNRMLGERLPALVSFEQLKLAAGAVLLSPYLPLLFMGEEYGESAPFQYFVSHSDSALVEAVRAGRRDEFAEFAWKGEVPDPQDEGTLAASRLRPMESPRQRVVFEFYKELIRLRTTAGALAVPSRELTEATGYPGQPVLSLHRRCGPSHAFSVFNFGAAKAEVRCALPEGTWRRALDSSAPRWDGPGGGPAETLDSKGTVPFVLPGWSFAVYLG